MTKPLVLLALLPLLPLCGCSELDNCPDESTEVIEITRCPEDEPDCNSAVGVYMSSPWEGPREPFPARTTMRFAHGLGTTPELVQPYVSFHAEDHDVSLSPGNQSRIRCIDDTAIWVKNDTCEESFYVIIVAMASGTMNTTCTCEERFAGTCSDESD